MVHTFPAKMPENGRKNIFRDNEPTNKELLMFLDIKLLKQK